MYTDREEFEGWMQRIMQRFDTTEKLLERVLKRTANWTVKRCWIIRTCACC